MFLPRLLPQWLQSILALPWRRLPTRLPNAHRKAVNKEEEKVRDFYDQYGWAGRAGITGEDVLFRDFSPPYYPYHARVNARTIDCFAGLQGRLLMAGGGDLPETHVSIVGQFAEATCLDISTAAIEIARDKLGGRGEFIVGSILNVPKPDAYFDAVFCAHVIYHIDRELQDHAVRELIRVTKPGGRIVVIYVNLDSLPSRLVAVKDKLPLLWRIKRRRAQEKPPAEGRPPLYFFAHPLSWWDQFNRECQVELKPWDVMGSAQEEAILINDAIAAFSYHVCSWFEDRYPHAAVRWWSYPLIVLTKRLHKPISH